MRGNREEHAMTYHLLSYEAGGTGRAGIEIGDTVWDAAELTGNSGYVSVIDVLDDWDAADQNLAAIASTQKRPAGGRPLSSVTLLAPVLYPGQIFAAGANYQDHIDEMDAGAFKAQNAKKAGGRPWFFGKTSRSAVIGPGSIRPLPNYSKKVDWEIELAVVIGRTASRVHANEALNHIAGYTIANDLSARDFVARGGVELDSPFRFDWISHKGFDGALPMGPWITPARFIAEPQTLDLKLWVDGELMQDSNTRHMIFSIAEQIEEISARVTLHPGDVILTGTPSGVGMSRGVFLKPGQQLRLCIEHVGELRHGFCD
jgi:2-keto-4-pentenoate hydratase/2-oxohepta-3-ene-1,7-dioic acid hydratase in catechol pathway